MEKMGMREREMWTSNDIDGKKTQMAKDISTGLIGDDEQTNQIILAGIGENI